MISLIRDHMRSGTIPPCSTATPDAGASGVFAGTPLLLRAELCASNGRRQQAELDLRDARRHLRTSSAAQFALPFAWIEAESARSGGDLDGARETLERALTLGTSLRSTAIVAGALIGHAH